MKLVEFLTEIGDPELYKKRRAEAMRIIRAEVDRRIKNMPPPGGIERRQGEERREDPPEKST